jgi:hypothetical protein
MRTIGTASPTRVEAATTRVESAPTRVEAATTRVKSAPTRVESAPTRVESAPTCVEAATTRVKSAPTRVEAATTRVKSAPTRVGSAFRRTNGRLPPPRSARRRAWLEPGEGGKTAAADGEPGTRSSPRTSRSGTCCRARWTTSCSTRRAFSS